MKLLISFTLFLTIVNIQLTTGANNYSTSNLKTIYAIIDTVKTAKNIWNAVKDLPPTLADILLTTFSKHDSQNNNTKQEVTNVNSNNNKQYGGSKMPRSSYDFVVDLTRPTDIYGKLKAYPLSFPLGKSAYDKKTKPDDQMSSRFIVNVIGRYNVGKTYVLRLLANIDLVHSFTERTNGISVSLPTPSNEHDPNIALIDTAGSRTPVDYNSKTFPRLAYERQISDAFIQEIALNSSEIFLVVINQLTLDDQLYLKLVRKRLKVRKLFRSIQSKTRLFH
jgi:predicted GTPase